jgi:nitroreductase
VELYDVIRRRRMVRAFLPRPVPDDVVDRVLGAALAGPSAGFTQALELLALTQPAEVARFWDRSLPPERRDAFPWPHLLDAPVLVLPVTRPEAYVERYAEPDKAAAGLGGRLDDWSVPYWWVDGGVGVGQLLLAAVDAGLGALFFGLFDRERAVLDAFGVPADRRALGAVALGYPDPDHDRPSSSSRRGRRPAAAVVHRGRW